MNVHLGALSGAILALVASGGQPARAQERPPIPAEARPVPKGIKGARFGMRPAELREALPGLVEVEEVAAEEVRVKWASASLAGKRLRARTTIGPREARCVFAFTAGERLTRIECTLDTGKDRKRYDATWTSILRTLRAKYGQPASTPTPYGCEKDDDMYLKKEDCNGTWVWADRGARLEVEATWSRFSTMLSSSITIVNQSPDYEKDKRAAIRKAEKQVEADEREARRKEAVLQRHSRSYDKDL